MGRRPSRVRARGLLLAAGLVAAAGGLLASPAGAAGRASDRGAFRAAATTTSTTTVPGTTSPGAGGSGTSQWPPPEDGDLQPPQIPDSVSPAAAASWLEGALAARAKELAALQQQVGLAHALPPAVAGPLGGSLATASAGVQALQSRLPADTSLPQLRSAAATMVGLRVFVLLSPQVHDVLEAERQLAVAAKLASVGSALQAAIAAEQSAPAARRLQTLYREYTANLGAVERDQATVTQLLSLTPQGFAAAPAALSAATQSLLARSQALGVVRSDVHQILTLLARPARG